MRWMLLALLFALNVLAVPAHAEIDALQCPVAAGQSLSDYDIFDQSADGKDYLTADEDGFNLDGNHIEGHKLYLACHYSDGSTKQLEIPGNLDVCSPVDDNVVCR